MDLQRIRKMDCCICGIRCFGRQWWNRDTGFGICPRCAEYEETKISPKEHEELYGKPNVHYLRYTDIERQEIAEQAEEAKQTYLDNYGSR